MTGFGMGFKPGKAASPKKPADKSPKRTVEKPKPSGGHQPVRPSSVRRR